MSQAVIAGEPNTQPARQEAANRQTGDTRASYTWAVDQLYALGQELAPLPPLPDGTPAPRRKWDLAYMRALCAALDNPQQTFPSILIAGTNGKGSTAATLASILSAAGYKTGLYTSPHLVRVNERIQILGGKTIKDPVTPQDAAILTEAKNPRISPEPPQTPGAPRLDSETWHVNPPPALSSGPHTPGAPSIAPWYLAMGGTTEIPDATFARLFARIEDTSTALVDSGSLPHPPSFFEVLTALAFLYYAEEKVDIAILEVGLGGRLDATNIVDPLISVITDIALDHQDYLGNTIAAITREKAGILRENGILVTLPQHPEANQAIGEAAATLNLTAISAADFIPAQHQHSQSGSGTDVGVPHPSPSHRDGWDVSRQSVTAPQDSLGLSAAKDPARAHITPAAPTVQPQNPGALPRNHYTLTLNNQPLEVDSPLPGHHQQRNIALAIATANTLRNLNSYNLKVSNQKSYNISNSGIEAGIRDTRWPGRLEFLPPNLLLDVAHNPAGAWTLRAAIAQLPESQPRTLIFSCLSDKNLTEISRILFPLFDSSPEGGRPRDHIVLASIANPRAAKVEDLLAAAHALEIPAHAAPHLAGALSQARAITPVGGLIIATGSVYLVGAIRDLATAHPTNVAGNFSQPEARVPHPPQSCRDGRDISSPKESALEPTEPIA